MAAIEPETNWEETGGFSSSNIAAFRFDKSTDTLQVDFLDGSTYNVFNVSPATHRAFQVAGSKGQFYNRVFKKGGYAVEPADG